MKKEVFIAVFIGLSLGLIITYGIYRMRMALDTPPTTITVENDPETEPSSVSSSLSVINPTNGTVQLEKASTVTGSTLPNAYVVVFVNNEDHIATADATGNYSVEVPLTIGANTVKIHVIDELGQVTTEERVVVVQAETVSAPEATTSAKAANMES